MIDTKLSEQMQSYIKQAAESAALELWTAVNNSVDGNPRTIPDLTSESVRQYCDVVSSIILTHINEKIGNGHEHS